MLLLLSLLSAIALPSPSEASSTAFKDSFRAYTDMRRLEERQELLGHRNDLEPEEKAAKLREVSGQLTQARIDFHAILPNESSTLSDWEQKVLSKLSASRTPRDEKKSDAEALLFLSEAFPKARNMSAFEWQLVSEFFGASTQQQFFNATFEPTPLPEKTRNPTGKKIAAVWISTPAFPILSSAEASRQKAERAQVAKKLSALGFELEEIKVSPFIRMEDQAEDLKKTLNSRLDKGEAFLLSQGAASAVLLRTFDLYPELIARAEVRGWMNLNGQLYGVAEPGDSRKPASLVKVSAADRQDQEVKQEFLRLRLERLEPQAPLGAKFPVLNLITLNGKQRPAANLRESVIPEGRTVYLKEGNGIAGIEAALPSMVLP